MVIPAGNKLTREDILNFASTNKKALKNPENYLGTWQDGPNGPIYLDTSKRFDPSEIRSATKFGEKTGQLAGYDVGAGQTIPVGNWEQFINSPEFIGPTGRLAQMETAGRDYLSNFPTGNWWDIRGSNMENVYGKANLPQVAGFTASTAPVSAPRENIQTMSEYMRRYIKGEPIRDTKNDKFIKEFVAYYKLTYLDKVIPMGELNQKRPLQFMGNEVFIGGRDFNIGATVTDVTVEGATKAGGRTLKGKTIYLSLKFGPTVTFANPGIATLFPEREFKTGRFTSAKGKSLLKMLGLDEAQFIKTFNAYANNTHMNKFKEDVTQKMNQRSFQNFLKSGIGYGYHMVHLLGQTIKDKEMTEDYLTKATKVTKAIAYYGGMSGGGAGPVTAKRIDIIITTSVYTFKINLRSKSYGKVYPANLMIDYSYV
jgi:hypothetical protein